MGKLLEKAWLLRANPIILSKQSKLQRGFTPKCSSTNAALMITESIAEAKDNKTPLYATFLDVTKAFDVVQHSILMNDIQQMGIEGDLWLLLQQLYNSPTTSVKWKSKVSDTFSINQGVRQGGASSAPIYKCYTNSLLQHLENQQVHKVGTINISAPTCADDMAILATQPEDMQAAIDLVETYAGEHHYGINPSKSATLAYNTQLQPSFIMENNEIPYSIEYTHLGVVRNQTNQLNTDERIQLARRTLYALMGAGVHGKDGLSPQISHHIWSTYVIPRMLYGLEVSIYKNSDLLKLDAFQRKTLRQLQFLPEKPAPANQAVYGLLGAKPIKAVVEQSTLIHFGNILRSEESIELELAYRQLAIKTDKSKSWFIHVKQLLTKYGLPSPYELLISPPEKSQWKSTVSAAINSYCNEESRLEAGTKSSLCYLNTEDFAIGAVHPVWGTLHGSCRKVEMAAVKARLLTGTYILQANRAKFNQFDVDPTCTICGDEPEDRLHFIMRCRCLAEVRQHHVRKLQRIFGDIYCSEIAESITSDQGVLFQLILDCTHGSLSNLNVSPPLCNLSDIIEPTTRIMCYSLHVKRASLLEIYVR